LCPEGRFILFNNQDTPSLCSSTTFEYTSSEALAALLGPDAPGLSQTTISRLKTVWKQEYDAWRGRDLSQKEYVYVWADGVHFNVRMDQHAQL